ncbi:MAG: hypothetical protein MZV63_16090 [Marinilabiliales bacterium]|nr:hypothetical protein [Marinilabiliales bacterium]
MNEKADLALLHLEKSLEFKEGKGPFMKCDGIFQTISRDYLISRRHG